MRSVGCTLYSIFDCYVRHIVWSYLSNFNRFQQHSSLLIHNDGDILTSQIYTPQLYFNWQYTKNTATKKNNTPLHHIYISITMIKHFDCALNCLGRVWYIQHWLVPKYVYICVLSITCWLWNWLPGKYLDDMFLCCCLVLFTWRSLSFSWTARCRRSSGDRYLWLWNRRSRLCVCCGVNRTWPPLRFELQPPGSR